jgi:ankyrin repeat protein
VSADERLLAWVKVMLDGDDAGAARLVDAQLAAVRLAAGATRRTAKPYFFDEIQHYLYAGDTALHAAAAAHRARLLRALVAAGADVGARNRRGAEPLHYAADAIPGSPTWNPRAQAAAVTTLIAAGADPNAADDDGVTPLHRAVRNRCAAAVQALVAGGADVTRKTDRGSTPLELATRATGRGGSGSPAAKAQQREILRLLER